MPQVSCQGFRMLFDMLWHQHGDEHIHVLLNCAQMQRELHQAESFQRETEEYRQWLTQASQAGCRGLFRTLKKDELPFLRPFQEVAREQRMAKRLEQWGAIWQIQDQPVLIGYLICFAKINAVTLGSWQTRRDLPRLASFGDT